MWSGIPTSFTKGTPTGDSPPIDLTFDSECSTKRWWVSTFGTTSLSRQYPVGWVGIGRPPMLIDSGSVREGLRNNAIRLVGLTGCETTLAAS